MAVRDLEPVWHRQTKLNFQMADGHAEYIYALDTFEGRDASDSLHGTLWDYESGTINGEANSK